MRNSLCLLVISVLATMPIGASAQSDSIRFDTAVYLTGGSQSTSIVTSDFDSDSRLDLFAGSSVNGNWYFFKDTGQGHFAAAQSSTCDGGHVYCLARADFDSNGTMDVAVACFSDVYLFLNDGAGNFNVQEGDSLRAAAPSQIIAPDLNKDGRPDIVTSNYNNANVSVLINQGAGLFDTAQLYGVGVNPGGVCAADFDHDGNLDLAVPCMNSRAVYLLRGNGDGTFNAATSFGVALHYASQIAAADFDGDGFADLAVTNLIVSHPGLLDIFLNDGSGGFTLHETDTVDVQPRDLLAEDFDKDGNFDLAVSCLDNGLVCLLKGMGDGSFGKAARYAVGGGVVRICSGDFNKDSYLDLAASSWFGDVSVLINQASAPADVNDDNGHAGVPATFLLSQNYPNPFNPTTKIAFELPRRAEVTVTIYNVLGARVKTIYSGAMPAGRHELTWDGKDDAGNSLGSGIYFYNLVAGDYHATKKMVLLK